MEAWKALVCSLLFVVIGHCYAAGRSKLFNGLREVNPPHKYTSVGWILIGLKRVKCGAVLITPTHALTAASCAGADIVNVTFGDHDRSDTNGQEQTFIVKNTIIHPNYNATTFEYDVAILVLDTPATFTPSVGFIVVLTDYDGLADKVLNKRGRVVGWGYEVGGNTSLVRDQSAVLNEITVVPTECADNSTTHFCYTPFRDPNSFACEGDVGGAYLLKKKGVFHLGGILSAWSVGEGCVAGERAMTPMPLVESWIESIVV